MEISLTKLQEFSEKYFDLLTNEYKGINLTRIVNFDDFYTKQILDSIEPVVQSTQFREKISNTGLVVDVGFGGGFPILPLAWLMPEIEFIGIETRAKKTTVVAEISRKLGLNNVKLHHERIENILIDRDAVCTFKAVGKVDKFLACINSNKNVAVYFYKGPGFEELEKQSLLSLKNTWKMIEKTEVKIAGLERRCIVGFQPYSVPCGTTNIKNLVKVSNIP